MSAPRSAGILMWRREQEQVEVLLGHFGGPFWARKDEGAWAMPKGLIENGEAAEAAAGREFHEEMGSEIDGALTPLGTFRQKGGKVVEAFAVPGTFDCSRHKSNSFTVEWPPRSGRFAQYPEIDRAAWFNLESAYAKILPSQRPILDALAALLAHGPV